MVWEPEVEEIRHRVEMAKQMGAEDRLETHRKRGKLTVRERLAAFVGEESFQEIGRLSGTAVYEDDELASFTPASTIIGIGELGGRKIVINASDFTVRGGIPDGDM